MALRVESQLLDSIVFFSTSRSFPVKFSGTGFAVWYGDEQSGIPIIVTCKHIAQEIRNDYYMRVNLKGGGSELLLFGAEPSDWILHPDPSVDLAILPLWLSPALSICYYDIRLDAPPDEQVLCGDPVAIVGLFWRRPGVSKNTPVVHSGNVAAIADRSEPIALTAAEGEPGTSVVAHLIHANTMGGLSGSPVFVQKYVHFPNYNLGDNVNHHPVAFGRAKFFGIYQGSFKIGSRGLVRSDDGGTPAVAQLSVGMGLVVPGEELLRFMASNAELQELRQTQAHRFAPQAPA